MPRLLYHLAQLTFVSPLIAIIFFYVFVRRQYLGPILVHSYRMLKMRRWFSVRSPDRPSIPFLDHTFGPPVDHGFDREHHSGHNLHSFTPLSIIWNLGIFMKFLPHTVSYQLPHNTVSETFHIALY